MKLTYRGITYETHKNYLEIQEEEITHKSSHPGTNGHYPHHIPQTKPKVALHYRGLGYTKPVATTVKEPPFCAIAPRQSVPPIADDDLKKIHGDNVRRNLETRLQAAQDSGNGTLMQMLMEEYQQLQAIG